MSKQLLMVNQVAATLGESVHVVRNWLRDFKAYIPVEKSDAGYNLFGAEAMDVMRTIKQLHRVQKYTTKQIEHHLASGEKDFVPAPAAAAAPAPIIPAVEVDELRQLVEKVVQQNMQLMDRLDAQQAFIETSMRERDERLMQTLRELQAQKQLQGEQQQPARPRWKWFGRK